MKRWRSVPLAFLFVLGLMVPAWANEELHPGGRLFFPLWDVSTPNRLTFIIVTRDALNEGQAINADVTATADNTTFKRIWTLNTDNGNCRPRGKEGSTSNINRTDLTGSNSGVGDVSLARGVFVDDVHFEYYGKSCNSANEIIHMSCSDIDLFLLASFDNATRKPRKAFQAVAAQGRGALDVHLIENSFEDKTRRKLENSLMGHAIISDLAEGWAAVYPAAAAKATYCPLCDLIPGGAGSDVGYEAYPMEVYLPWAYADEWPVPGGALRNILSLWGPAFMPGGTLSNTTIDLDWKWWDGREREKSGSIVPHAVIAPLGGTIIAGLDNPIDPDFKVSSFTCNRNSTAGGFIGAVAENDGFPRNANGGADSLPGNGCNPGSITTADTDHPSDNYENAGDVNTIGHSIQQSTSIGWWRFQLNADAQPPLGFVPVLEHSGRGLVGVVLSSVSNALVGVGDSWRLWHKDPCEIAQSNETLGPPHLRDFYVYQSANNDGIAAGDYVAFFNALPFWAQGQVCRGNGLSS